MRRLLIIIGTFLLILLFAIYKEYHLKLFEYRVVRVGYTKIYYFMDSLFNEFYDEDDEKEEDLFAWRLNSNDKIDETESDVDDSNKDDLAGYTWSELNNLMELNLGRIKNASAVARESPTFIQDKLKMPLNSILNLLQSYESRLKMTLQRMPPYLTSSKPMLESISESMHTLYDLYKNTVATAIKKIADDDKQTLKTIVVRFAKILRQFEHVIQLQNDAHLECTCDVAKKLNKILINTLENRSKCINKTSDAFAYHIKDTQLPVMHFMESSMFFVSQAMKKSKSSVDAFYQLPMQVRIFLNIFFFFWYFCFDHRFISVGQRKYSFTNVADSSS